ncbi:hypothetical protein BCT41_24320 [Vibrio splendidus]|nr:hypothetical protein BCT41_24320 [Vibrio splendidus]
MRLNTFIKTALVAVLFISYHLNGFSSDLNPVQCQIKNNDLMLTVNNSMASSFTVSTSTGSSFTQNTSSGTTKLILNMNQFPAVIKFHPNKAVWKINKGCKINQIKNKNLITPPSLKY